MYIKQIFERTEIIVTLSLLFLFFLFISLIFFYFVVIFFAQNIKQYNTMGVSIITFLILMFQTHSTSNLFFHFLFHAFSFHLISHFLLFYSCMMSSLCAFFRTLLRPATFSCRLVLCLSYILLHLFCKSLTRLHQLFLFAVGRLNFNE